MGVDLGPNKVNDGLVFGYDTGYGVADNSTATRFFPGEPTTNLVPSGQSTGTSVFQRQGYHVEVFTYSQITDYRGRPNVHKLYINPTTSNPYADFGGQYYKSGGSVVGDVYTISFDYYTTKGTGTPGMAVVYANGYKTPTSSEAASLSSATVIDLENGWKRKTQTATITTAGNSWFRLGLNSNSVETEVYIDNFQVELNSHATPFSDGTRSSTQSLIDLTKTRDIDVSNVSFDSTGQPTFDGTDDHINLPTSLIDNLNTTQLTVEAVVYHTSWGSSSGSRPYIANWNTWSPGNQKGFILRTYTTSQYPSFWYCWGANYTNITASTQMNLNQYYHVVGVFKKDSYAKIYVNGVEAGSSTTGTGNNLVYDTSTGTRIGYGTINTGRMVGNIPVAKIYSQALTAAEVKQNFNAHRKRFNL